VSTSIAVHELHINHPCIRASDWRSPLVIRLCGESVYAEGSREINNSYRSKQMSVVENILSLSWEGLLEDYEQCLRTYQAPVITEMATLGLACVLMTHNEGREITEVTRRGEKADYWIGDKEELLEVSGQQDGNLDNLCTAKAEQLLANPFQKSGYVCVATYSNATSRLWYFSLSGGHD